MSLTLRVGDRLGPFEILGAVGAGGMGEVYRARDTRLDREVALKVLPQDFAADAQRLARFEREARLLAALSHPNVAVVHEVESIPAQGDRPPIHYIVMELVGGDLLSDLIADGPLALEEVLRITSGIASGLAAAHDKDIVHRDLKPSNVKLTPGGVVKVLDFGLATMEVGPAPDDERGETPTVTLGPTIAGTVLGTPPYMSPEQARGLVVDHRTDLWSLGCVLYEMLTGRLAFGGETPTDTAVAILDREPDWARLPEETPGPVRELLHQLLEKEVDQRAQSALDVRNRVERIRDDLRLAGRGDERAVALHGSKSRWVPALLVVAMAVGLLAVWWLSGSTRHAEPVAEATKRPTEGPGSHHLSQITFGAELEQWPAFSPDGTRLAYCVERDGYLKLALRDLATGEELLLTEGPGDDAQPSWSSDGRSLAFVRARGSMGKLDISDALSGYWSDGDVWRLDLESGEESRLVEEAFNPASSPSGGRIAVDASWAGPRRIWTVDERGRNPRQVTTGESEAEVHSRPGWSPDGRRIVFQLEEKTKLDVRVVEMATGEITTVTDDPYFDLDPIWSPDGSHIYFSSYRGGGLNIWRVPVSKVGEPTGPPEQITTGAGQDIQPALTLDGTRLGFTVLSQNADLWRLPLDPASGQPTGAPQAFVVSTREDSRGAWSPDGTRLAFNSDRDGQMNIWIHKLEERQSTPATRGAGGDYQPNWSPDGRSIVFFSSRSGNPDIWKVDVESGELDQLTDAPGVETNAFFSPDGKLIAYQSDHDGRKEVWVMTAEGGEARSLSTIGANDHFMRWSADGRYIYFRSSALPTNGVHRVPVEGGEAEDLGIPAGWHISFSPDQKLLLDVVGHETLWIFPLDGAERRIVFESEDPSVRMDYPEWSPDGRWVVYDRVSPQGGDIWLIESSDQL